MGRIDLTLKDKKIVFLLGFFGRGGSQRQAYLLAREFRERHGLDAEVWSLTERGEYADEFEAAGVPTSALEFRYPISPIKPLRYYHWAVRLQSVAHQLKGKRVDILLPFTVWPNVVAGLTYRWAGVRTCIWGERSAGLEHLPGPGGMAVKQYRRFVANSTAGVEYLAQSLGIAQQRISLVPNGVELPQIDINTSWRSRLGIADGQPLVAKIANVTKYKDHATLLRAWKILQDVWTGGERPMLALAGFCEPGPVYDNCLQLVRETGLESTVRFLGSVHDVPALLHACDLTVFSSPKEGMPNGVLECMAAGKAIVASDLPGVRDALGPNAGDILVPPGDHVRFAQLLLALLSNNERCHRLGTANRARIQAEFSVQRIAEQHLEIIRGSLLERYAHARHPAFAAEEQRAA